MTFISHADILEKRILDGMLSPSFMIIEPNSKQHQTIAWLDFLGRFFRSAPGEVNKKK